MDTTDKLLLSVGLIVLIWLFSGFKFSINYTDSIPIGLYFVSESPAGKGDYTAIADSAILSTAYHRGYIAKGTYIGKKVLGVSGDTISVTENGVYVNGNYVAHSKPLHQDSQGRSLPIFRDRLVLRPDQVFLLSENNRGYDSRYFGPVKKNNTAFTLLPVITF